MKYINKLMRILNLFSFFEQSLDLLDDREYLFYVKMKYINMICMYCYLPFMELVVIKFIIFICINFPINRSFLYCKIIKK
jgi:hypothetical protein